MQIIKRTATLKDVFVGEGRFDLRLRIGELMELEELTGCGAYELVERFNTARFRVRDVRETVRLGLIGGGMNPHAAYNLINKHVVEGYLADYVGTAGKLILYALSGPEEDPVGEPEAAPVTPTPEAAKSAGRTSTRSRAPRADQSKRSSGSPSGNSTPPLKDGATSTPPQKPQSNSRQRKTTQPPPNL